MEHLFIYTLELTSKIASLCEDITLFQRILDEKKKSSKASENVKICEKEIKKQVYFLRILEHVSYLEEYKNDIARAIEVLDAFVERETYTSDELKKIRFTLSSIAVPFNEAEETNGVVILSLQVQCVHKLDATMKIVEEILLSFYGLTSPKEDLEDKLIKCVESLFALKLEDLSNTEKVLIEEFFTHIQDAFKSKGLEGWEQAYITCTGKLNELKELAGMQPDSSLSISMEMYESDDDSVEEISFEPWEEDESEDDEEE